MNRTFGLSRLCIRFLADARHTFRLWARHPMHTLFAIAALAIGIGAATGGFSIVNTLLLAPLPFSEPERLTLFHPAEFIPPHDSSKQFHDWRQQSTYLADAALVEEKDVNIGSERQAIRAHAARASWNLFAVLGAKAALGRTFLSGEDSSAQSSLAVISDGLWQQLFAGDPRVLGSSIRVDGAPLTIVGVMPRGFDYPRNTAIWTPAGFSPGNNGWETVGRLKKGITWPQARAAFDADVARLSATRDSAASRPSMKSLQEAFTGQAAGASLVLMAAMGLVLLTACTNVANLLLGRVAGRASELSIRSALGASAARLKQQLVTECLLLCTVAALFGSFFAVIVTSIANKVQPPPLATMSYSLLNVRVLAFSIVVSLVAGVVFGVLPGRAGKSRAVGRFLTAVQVTFTIMLLTSSITVGRAFVQLMTVDRGYDAKGIVTVNVSLDGTPYQTPAQHLQYFEEVLMRVRGLPGVRSASSTEFLPLYATGFVGGRFGVDGQPASRNSTMVPTFADYFRTMGGRMLEGREFTDAEVASGSRVAVVNERFAAGFGGPREVLGRQLTIGRGTPWKIIGVVRGMEFETDASLAKSNQVFVPAESPGGFYSTFVVKIEGSAEDRAASIFETIRSIDPRVPVFGAKTMEQRLADFFIRPRAYRAAVWMFAGVSVLLALIGIYGIVSQSVAERTSEIGVRMALGATPARVRGAVLLQTLIVVSAGAALGIAGSAVTERFLESLIAGANPVDWMTSAMLAFALATAASITVWSATRRIPQLDIMRVIRRE